MMDPAAKENWTRAYREAPEIFDAFSQAEDPEGQVARSLHSLADLSGRTVVELGCGTGRYLRDLAPLAGRYIGVEPSAAMLAIARSGSRGSRGQPWLLRARGEALPFRTGSVDLVLAAWVVVNLRPESRLGVLAEAARILRRAPRCGVWLVENHWDSQFQRYRGRGAEDESRIQDLIHRHGFRMAETISTELRFPSAAEAERVLGYLCGERMREQLRREPSARIGHRIVLLHRPPEL